MKAIRISETKFDHNEQLDFNKNKRLMIVVNLAAVISFVFFYYIFYFVVVFLTSNKEVEIFYYFTAYKKLPAGSELLLLFIILIVFTLHELIHGAFFYLFTGEKPVFGYKLIYAYAGAPNWYIRKKYFLVISLSPFILITALGLLGMVIVHDNYSALIFLTITAHAAGCTGDFWISFRLLKKPKNTFVNDLGVSSTISY